MNKEVKRIFYIIICSSLLSLILWGCTSNKSELLIRNISNEEITNVMLDYTNAEDVNIGILKPDQEDLHQVKDITDDSIKLIFIDSSGNKHEETIVGYVTKNMGRVTVVIKKLANEKWLVETE